MAGASLMSCMFHEHRSAVFPPQLCHVAAEEEVTSSARQDDKAHRGKTRRTLLHIKQKGSQWNHLVRRFSSTPLKRHFYWLAQTGWRLRYQRWSKLHYWKHQWVALAPDKGVKLVWCFSQNKEKGPQTDTTTCSSKYNLFILNIQRRKWEFLTSTNPG